MTYDKWNDDMCCCLPPSPIVDLTDDAVMTGDIVFIPHDQWWKEVCIIIIIDRYLRPM